MLTRRLIACLDVDGSGVVKGVGFRDMRRVGDPVALAERYGEEGADEIVLLDVAATREGRATLLDTVRRCAERLFVPLTVGGGVRDPGDVALLLRAGADKVAINSAAIADPSLIVRAAARFGAQCVVVSIDAARTAMDDAGAPEAWRVRSRGGTCYTPLDALEWAQRAAELGAGEILLTSIDRDGTRTGFDLQLTRAVARRVAVPVVASGGAGTARHFVQVFEEADADAALAAGIFHDGTTGIADVKGHMETAGLPVRGSGTA